MKEGIKFYLFGSILSKKPFLEISDIDLFVVYSFDSKTINHILYWLKKSILNTYKKPVHITALTEKEFKDEMVNIFHLKKMSLYEIKLFLDTRVKNESS